MSIHGCFFHQNLAVYMGWQIIRSAFQAYFRKISFSCICSHFSPHNFRIFLCHFRPKSTTCLSSDRQNYAVLIFPHISSYFRNIAFPAFSAYFGIFFRVISAYFFRSVTHWPHIFPFYLFSFLSLEIYAEKIVTEKVPSEYQDNRESAN